VDALVSYFEGIPSTHRAAILAGGIAFFWLWESAAPAFAFEYRKWSHAAVNVFFTMTTVAVNFALAFVLLFAADYAVEREVGMLFLMDGAPLWVQLMVCLLLLDLISAWLAHWVQHKTPVLWRLHLIHHSDTHVDTTSANRHHPGESVVRFAFTVAAVFITGSPMWMVFLYQALSVVLSQFNHANIALPAWLDRGMAWVIVSPDMHKVHHHYGLELRQHLLGVGPAVRDVPGARPLAADVWGGHAHGSGGAHECAGVDDDAVPGLSASWGSSAQFVMRDAGNGFNAEAPR
jgi:sterol desaturase/sphingolipid hydroxylase (fatty acid hydroxylase superfamily)